MVVLFGWQVVRGLDGVCLDDRCVISTEETIQDLEGRDVWSNYGLNDGRTMR